MSELNLFRSLAQAQGNFLPILRSREVTVKTRAGDTYKFSYAPLEKILQATVPALNAEGFALTQHVDEVFVEGEEQPRHYLVTTLRHECGELSNRIRILLGEPTPQAYGSAVTYARRMGVTQILCVAADDDEDGNAASGNKIESLRDKEPAPKPEISLELARKHAFDMIAIIMAPAKDGDHDELQKSLTALDYHDNYLAGNNELYIAAADQMEVTKRNIWKGLIKKAKDAQKKRHARE